MGRHATHNQVNGPNWRETPLLEEQQHMRMEWIKNYSGLDFPLSLSSSDELFVTVS